MKLFTKKQLSQCIYCDNKTDEEKHFVSDCCGRGMCEECYQNLVGTEYLCYHCYSNWAYYVKKLI